MSEESQPNQRIIITSTKSILVSLLLTFFLGPIGMLYSTLWGALFMIAVSVVVWLITLGFGLFLVWPICMIWGALAAALYNKKLFAQLEK